MTITALLITSGPRTRALVHSQTPHLVSESLLTTLLLLELFKPQRSPGRAGCRLAHSGFGWLGAAAAWTRGGAAICRGRASESRGTLQRGERAPYLGAEGGGCSLPSRRGESAQSCPGQRPTCCCRKPLVLAPVLGRAAQARHFRSPLASVPTLPAPTPTAHTV